MKKGKEIKWNEHPEFKNDFQGKVNDQEVFNIKPLKNSTQWVLTSWPYKTEAFNNSFNSKQLGVFLDIGTAKDFAENKWQSFISELSSDN